MKASKKPIYLASQVSIDTSCGLHESPWILEAKPGQQVTIDLIDFTWKNKTSGSNPSYRHSSCDINYGYILDMETDDVINICGGGDREKRVYESSGNRVQIIIEGSVLGSHQFVIKFKGI